MISLAPFVARRRRRPRASLAEEASRLDEEARAVAILVWTRRSTNEAASVALAERLAADVALAGLDETTTKELAAAFARLEEDEAAHVADANDVLAALGADAPATKVDVRAVGTEPLDRLVHDTMVGLFLCESVSASRFASVWASTDLPAFRERIGVFLRDEIAHAALGRAIAPFVLAEHRARVGEVASRAFVRDALVAAIAELVAVVAHGVPLAELPPPRAQPTGNPGIVEPAVDARALYRTLDREVRPLLAALDTGNPHAFERRLTRPRSPAARPR